MDFLDCIKYVTLREAANRFPLTENAATYKQMMAPVIQAMNKIDPSQAGAISEQVAYYKNALGRSDRIIWALRWLRLSYLQKMRVTIQRDLDDGRADHDEEFSKVSNWVWSAHRKCQAELLNSNPAYGDANGVENQRLEFDSRMFANKLHHFMSYVDRQSNNYIKGMEDLVWQWQSPEYLIEQMTQIEEEWKETREQELSHAEDSYSNATKIIDFGDGYAWWNLGVQFCDAEGASMGHCGNNSYMKKDGDTLVSLRQEVTRGGERFHIPALTFILNNGWLGEMKGRGNEKPAPRYHPYIVALLKTDHIEGIRGGGYMPENNFSVYDLNQEQRDDLIAAKPSLEPLIDKFKRLGAVPEVIEMAQNEASNANLPSIYGIDEDGTVVLQYWNDLERLAGDVYNFDAMDAIIKVISDPDEIDQKDRDAMSDALSLDEGDVFEFLTHLPTEYRKRIADSLGITGDMESRKTLEKIALYIDRSKFRRLIADAFVATSTAKNIIEEPAFKDYIRLVLSCLERGTYLGQASLRWDGDFEDEIKLVMSFRDFISGIDDVMQDDESDDSGFRQQVGHSEWLEIESWNLKEAWDEYDPTGKDQDLQTWNKDGRELRKMFDKQLGVADKKTSQARRDRAYNGEKEPSESPIGEVDPYESARWFINHLDSTRHQTKGLFNSKKPKSEFDKLLEDIRKRAGL